MTLARRLHISGGALALVVGMCAASCGSTAQGDRDEPGGEVCRHDRECAADQTCRDGYCTRGDVTLRNARFEFVPPHDSGFSPQAVDDLALRSGEPLDFALEPNVSVRGEITYEGTGETPVTGPSGPLTFDRRNRANTLFDVQTRVDQGAFETRLLPGRYDLVFSPDDYPARTWRNLSFTANAERDDLSVPVKQDLATIQGKAILRIGSDGGESEVQPVTGADVFAVSQDGRHTSTFSTTGSEGDAAGRFELRTLPDTGPYDVIVDPDDETMLPKVRFADVFSAGEGFSELDEPLELGSYAAADRTEIQSSFSLQRALPEGVSGEAVEWSRVRVVAVAQLQDGRQFRRETTADAQGRIELRLIPATYQLRLYPPSQAPIASIELRVDLSTSDTNPLTDWNWPVKHELRGRVIDRGGNPVPDARITFEPVGLADSKFSDRLTVSTTSAADGTFRAPVERHDQRVLVHPPADSGLPRHYQTLDVERFTGGESIDIRLEAPLLLEGSVRGASESETSPIPGTSVRAVIERDGHNRQIGRATTDEDGSFLMIVPAPD